MLTIMFSSPYDLPLKYFCSMSCLLAGKGCISAGELCRQSSTEEGPVLDSQHPSSGSQKHQTAKVTTLKLIWLVGLKAP